MLDASDFVGDDGRCPYKSDKSRNAKGHAFTVLSSVCWYWRQTVTGWPDSPITHSLRHRLKKLIKRECTCTWSRFCRHIMSIYWPVNKNI